jgi:hypothetical protein
MLATTVEPLLIPLPEAVVCIFNQPLRFTHYVLRLRITHYVLRLHLY